MRGALERQLSSPTPVRHLSGDNNMQGNVAFNRSGRHASGDQVRVNFSSTFPFQIKLCRFSHIFGEL